MQSCHDGYDRLRYRISTGDNQNKKRRVSCQQMEIDRIDLAHLDFRQQPSQPGNSNNSAIDSRSVHLIRESDNEESAGQSSNQPHEPSLLNDFDGAASIVDAGPVEGSKEGHEEHKKEGDD